MKKETKIYSGDYIHPSVKIGKGTKIGTGHDVGEFVEIGENCDIQCHVSISNGWKIKNNVFVGPKVCFANDPYPPSSRLLPGIVENNAIICMGAKIGPGVNIGEGSVVGMGAIVRSDVLPNEVIVGDNNRVIYDRTEYDRRKALHESC